jgi:Ca2+-binding RTX toxin-like protein
VGDGALDGTGCGVKSNTNSFLSLTNSTISGKFASGSGGGMNIVNGFNKHIFHTICALVFGNTAPNGPKAFVNSTPSIFVNNVTLFGHRGLTNDQAFENFTPGSTDITATSNSNDPTALGKILNTTLANNGGPTRIHALVGGSPAIDTVTDGICPPPRRDQCGVTRPHDGNGDGGSACDIGLYELTTTPPIIETCDGLNATIVGTAGDESIPGTPGPDVIDGLGGVDIINALGGNDVLCGGSGNDTILSGPDNDKALGEIGNDLVRGGRGADQVHGAAGADQLFGDAPNDKLTGGTGTDRFDGGSGTDTASKCETRISIP